MKKIILLPLLLFSLLLFGQSKPIRIESGLIRGTTNEAGNIRIYKGIPFAAPPVGELRWKAPQPVESWKGVRTCDAFGPSPVQPAPEPFMFWSSEFLIPEEPISEDCLYLNVWTGAESTNEKRPVLVYIYGGGFRSGGSGCPIYDGEAMAEKGIVFVSINYRVGVFGFLAHPELTQEADYGASGNYALLDMIAALRWVQKNITAFGGDPNRVTIAGQSAGAFGVNYLTASPLARGLFHGAIAQSGGSFYNSPLRPDQNLEIAEQQGIEFAESLNCRSLKELRARPADELLQAQGAPSWPIVDGHVLPESIYDIYANGNQNDVPVLVGWNKDDKLISRATATADFRKQMQQRFGSLAEKFFQVYPTHTDEEAAQSQFNISRDETFGIQVYTWAKMQTQTGESKAFLYNFNRALPAYTPETQFGAFHSGEIVYAYDNLHTLDRPWEAVDHRIADAMSSYWANFAKTGNPNGKNLPKWKAYHPESEQVLIIDEAIQSKSLPTKVQMDFWERYFTEIRE